LNSNVDHRLLHRSWIAGLLTLPILLDKLSQDFRRVCGILVGLILVVMDATFPIDYRNFCFRHDVVKSFDHCGFDLDWNRPIFFLGSQNQSAILDDVLWFVAAQ
jgi:hypothetical protein